MKAAVLAILAAWIAGVTIAVTAGMATAYSLGKQIKLPQVMEILPDLAKYMGIVVAPPLLVVAVLAAALLSPSSVLWKPWAASLVGAVIVPFGYYFTAWMWHGKDIVRLFEMEWVALLLAATAAISGATFGFVFAALTDKRRRTEARAWAEFQQRLDE